MSPITPFVLIFAFLITLLIVFGENNNHKISTALTNSLETKSTVNILISLKQNPTKSLERLSKLKFSSRPHRSSAVYSALTQFAKSSQEGTLSILNAISLNSEITIKSLWITNQIAVFRASKELVYQIANIEQVSLIVEEKIIKLNKKIPSSRISPAFSIQSRNWGLDKIQVPEAWSVTGGNNGTGITVGVIDTGVRYTHRNIIQSYKNDNFSWFDPYNYTLYPNDQDGHGTHVTGTIVGTDGLGVAPGAEWIACKGLELDEGTDTALIQCAQFMICPHDPEDLELDCSKTPHVVCNSWGGSGGGDNWFNPLIRAWHIAGIIPVFANGNSGPECSSSDSPADYPEVISVGSTSITDHLAGDSSVGPSLFNVTKPDISAPGVDIVSASHASDSGFAIMSGTSMACPHVSGLVALMLSKNPTLSYNEIKSLLQSNTDRELGFEGTNCGGIPDNVFPNNHFGYGRINALKVIQAVAGESSGSNANIYSMSSLLLILCVKVVFSVN